MKEKKEAIRRTRKSEPEIAFRPLALKSCFFDSAVRLGFCRSKLSIQKQKLALPYFFFTSPLFFPLSSLFRIVLNFLEAIKPGIRCRFTKRLAIINQKSLKNLLVFLGKLSKHSGRYIIEFKSLLNE